MKPTIVITRPRAQSAAVTNLVSDAGFDVILVPTSRIENLSADEHIRELIQRVAEVRYGWIVFTSANAVSSFAQHLLAGGGIALPELVKIAAQGQATAALCVKDLGRAPDFVPSQAVSDIFAAELAPLVAGQTVLIPRSTLSGSRLAETLRAGGAQVDTIPLYATVAADPMPERLAELEGVGSAKLIFAFHSPSAFEHLFKVVPGIEKVLRGSRIAAIGPVTADAIRGAGYKPDIIAAEQSDAALVNAIVSGGGRGAA